MAYTKKQWDAQQASFPAEDRISYDEYLRAAGLENFRTSESANAPQSNVMMNDDSYYSGQRADLLAQQAAIIAAGNVLANYKTAQGVSYTSNSIGFIEPGANTSTVVPTVTPTVTPTTTATTYTPAQLQAIVSKLTRNEMLTDEEWAALGQVPPKTPTAPTPATITKTIKSETFTGTGKDRKKVITYDDNTTETIDAPEEVVGSDYEDVGGILTYKGKAYTGAYNGQNYVNGRVVKTPGDDIYETLNGVFQLNGKPYTGIYGDKEYKNGVEVPVGSGNYETIGGIFTFNGKAYTGEYNGKKYVNGLEQKIPVEDKYETVNGVFTKNGAAFTGEYAGKKYKNGILDEESSNIDGFTTKDGLLYENGKLFSGEREGKNYKNGLVVDATGEPERPANVNKFFVYNPKTKTWEKPPKPQDGATYTWNDNTGWVQETPAAVRPAGTPAAYIYDEKTKTWIKPPQADPNTVWDNDKGWIAKTAVVKKIKSETFIGTGANRKRVVTYDDNTTETFDAPETLTVSKKIKSETFIGTGANRKKVITYDDNTTETVDAPETPANGDGTSGTGVFTQKDIDAAVAAALKASTETTAKNNMIQILTDRFAQYGLSSLTSKIKELAISGATEATITLGLMETEEYKKRFSANADRIKKGLAVLSPAEYLNVEDSYRQVLRAYGLKQFDTDEYVKQFISNDISPTELSNRVVTAVQRVQNADPAIINQLKQYYGISATDMVGYVLDPEQSFQKIQRQIAASEIGVAAGRQGLTAGVSVAEQLAAQGVTEAEAQKGYATIADILPTAEKLSSIYGTTLDGYGQTEGEQEVFNSLASAQRKRQKLTAREIAAFSGSAGAAKTSLSTSRVGQF